MALGEVSTILSALKNGLGVWDRFNPKKDPKEKLEAIEKVMEAVTETRSYVYNRDVLNRQDRDIERELALAWQKAAGAILEFDSNLHDSSEVKSLGWADPRSWPEWRRRAKTIDLDLIEQQCNWLRSQPS